MTAEIDQEKLLEILNERSSFRSDFLAAEFGVDHQKIIGLVKSLQTNDGLVDVDEMVERRWELTAEGQSIAANGSHEYNVYKIVQDGVPKSVIDEQPYGKIGFGKAKQNGWVYTEMRDGVNYVLRKISGVQDSACDDLKLIQSGNVENLSKDSVKLMKNRKWINEIAIKVSRIVKGPNFQTSIQKQELDLTAEMVASGSWRHKNFKKYNFNAMGVPPKGGCLHPLLKVRSEFREIFFQMGFTEMETNRYVESSFWNFDALFQPQQHPARDAHDTFFLSEPSISTEFPFEYLKKVKKVHSEGGYGSIGYQYDWKIDEAKKNVLRTHTTAISARYLYDLSEKGFKPAKLFSIDRVFRNETLDATHLAEFHQVEGVVAERNLSLAHVIGLFTEFFRKCGIENLRFKPTYNPYTEPSMEVFAFHEGLNKWVEIGNSGMFRPEMLLPMGLPEDVGVAGFGLSLERPTMIRYGITNIRELFGHKINLETVQKSTICRLTKRN